MMTFINKKINQYDQSLQQYPSKFYLGFFQYKIPNPNFLKYFENHYNKSKNKKCSGSLSGTNPNITK